MTQSCLSSFHHGKTNLNKLTFVVDLCCQRRSFSAAGPAIVELVNVFIMWSVSSHKSRPKHIRVEHIERGDKCYRDMQLVTHFTSYSSAVVIMIDCAGSSL